MALSIISLICGILFFLSLGVFEVFVIFSLREIKAKTNSLNKPYWAMGVYMDDIPQNEQNILGLKSVPLKIYAKNEYTHLPIPRKGEEIRGIYYNEENQFEMIGIVYNITYALDKDCLLVECKCTSIQKLK